MDPAAGKGHSREGRIRLLLQQCSPAAAERLAKVLPRSLFALDVVERQIDLLPLLQGEEVGAVILDLSIPRLENRASFDALRGLPLPPPVVACGRAQDLPTIKKFLQHGAFSFFLLEDDPDVIIHAVRNAARHRRIAAENARLAASLSAKKKTIEVLKRVGETVSSLSDMRRVLDLTIKVVRRALDCEACCLYVLDGTSGKLVESRDVFRPAEHPQLELWDGKAGRDRRTALHQVALEALQKGEIVTDLPPPGGVEWHEESGRVETAFSGVIAAPILLEGKPKGVLLTANKLGGDAFSPDDLEILQSVAAQTSYLLAYQVQGRELSFQESLERQLFLATSRLKARNMELTRRLEEEEAAKQQIAAMADEISEKNRVLTAMLEQFRAIHEVSSEIGSELESDALIKKIIEATASYLSAETVSLMLKEEDGSMKIEHAMGLSSEVIKGTRVAPNEGISGWVAEEGKPILVRDVKSFRRGHPERHRYYSNSLLCVPLKIKGKVIGVLNVTNRVGGAGFEEKDLNLLTILGNHAAIAMENARLYKAVRDNYFATIKALVNAVEAKDTWTRDHSENVTNYSLKIADFLGLSERQKEIIRYAGVLHDIGKIVISSTITDKVGHLTDEEWRKIREHPLIGQRILDPIEFLEPVKVCIQTHHERCDGTGYPFGLSGHEISLETRIISVADAFDAMTHSRPYRTALSLESAVKELRDSAGTQFDPVVVKSLVKILEAEGNYPAAAC